MKVTIHIAPAIAALIGAAPAMASNLAYVEASTQRNASTRPDRYHPLHLMDEDPGTIWCEGADGPGEKEEVRYHFKRDQRIDRVVVYGTPDSGRAIQQLRVGSESSSLTLTLPGPNADGSAPMVEQKITPPLVGKTFTVTILALGERDPKARLPGDVACLADVVLFFRNKPWGGRVTNKQLRYNAQRAKVLGLWNGGALGAPEKQLLFAIDGTWQWNSDPLLGGRKRRMNGEYRFRTGRLLMRKGEIGRWADMRLRHRRVSVDPDEIGAPLSDYHVIELGSLLGDDLKGGYNNAKF